MLVFKKTKVLVLNYDLKGSVAFGTNHLENENLVRKAF